MMAKRRLRIIKELISAKHKSMQKLYEARLAFQKALLGQKIVTEGRLHLNVSLRVEGPGTLLFGDKVCMGCSYGPKTGSGQILLQTKDEQACITIGAESVLNNNVNMTAYQSITIGQRCLIGDSVSIFDGDFHDIDPLQRHTSTGGISPVHLKDNVWIGSRAMIMKGVTIGENSVISAGAVVTKSIPPNVVAAGVPARVVKEL